MGSHGDDSSKKFFYLVGIGVSHSIAPPMHNYIAQNLELPWTFLAQECSTVEDAMALFRKPSFAGGVVTMPYKQTVMPHLDGLDELATQIGACNCVYRTGADGATLRGTNTDWRGVKGCLLNRSAEGKGKPAMIVGAGGACRAAVYALAQDLECTVVYVVNRLESEVAALRRDVHAYKPNLSLVHVRSVEEAQQLAAPYYIVGTVPDFEPQTPEEKACHAVLAYYLESAPEKGVLLDMCFKPRKTRTLKLGAKYGWQLVEGTEIIGHQIEEQYRLWAGAGEVPKEKAWEVLRRSAEESQAINF